MAVDSIQDAGSTPAASTACLWEERWRVPSTRALAMWWDRWGLITIVSALCYLVAMGAIWRLVLGPSFSHLEAQEANRDIERCIAALQREIDDVDEMTTDYATWDECHDFVKGANPSFVEKNFAWSHLDRAMGMQVYALLDAGGNILASDASPFLPESERTLYLSALPIATLRELAPTGPPPHPRASSGVASTALNPIIVAGAPIRRNSGEGASVGHMVLARLLNEALVTRIAQRASVPLKIHSCAASSPGDIPPIPKGGILLTCLGADSLRAETTIAGLAGQPTLHLVSTLPRPIMAQGRHAMRIIGWFAGIATALIAFLFGRQKQKARQLELRTNQLVESWHQIDDQNRQRTHELALLRETERELRRLRGRLDAVVRAVPIPLFAKDTGGRYILFNPAFDAFFGVRGESLIGRTASECWRSEDASIYHEHDMQLMREGGLQIYEHRLRDASGRERHVIFNKACFSDSEGKTAGLVGTLTDVTVLKEAESERRTLERQFQEAQKMESLGILAGGIAHDFNNLLVGILGHADLALLRIGQTDPIRSDLQAIITASQRAVDLCRQMLAYSGRGRFVIEHIDVNAAIREMAELLRVSVPRKIDIRLDLPGDAPPIDADITQIRQVIMNLITNASEAIGDSSGTIRVSTRRVAMQAHPKDGPPEHQESSSSDAVRIEVADTGCGMTPETAAKIFDPFFTTKFTGRGLGLAAVLGIVRGHKGVISVDSQPGRGTTFRITLPAAPARSVPRDTGSTAARQPKEWKGTGTILVADDEAAVRTVATKMCEHLGFSVIVAHDGTEAVRLLKETDGGVTCIVLDLIMPGMDGLETLSTIQAMRPEVPVILSSGYNESEVRRRFGKTGFRAFIQKPYQLAQLRDILRVVLDSPPGPS